MLNLRHRFRTGRASARRRASPMSLVCVSRLCLVSGLHNAACVEGSLASTAVVRVVIYPLCTSIVLAVYPLILLLTLGARYANSGGLAAAQYASNSNPSLSNSSTSSYLPYRHGDYDKSQRPGPPLGPASFDCSFSHASDCTVSDHHHPPPCGLMQQALLQWTPCSIL